MATYDELFDLRSNDNLRNRVSVAAVVKSQELIDSATPTAAEIAWANRTIEQPGARAGVLLNYVLAANKALTVAQIESAADSAIQSNVDSAADALIAGGVI